MLTLYTDVLSGHDGFLGDGGVSGVALRSFPNPELRRGEASFSCTRLCNDPPLITLPVTFRRRSAIPIRTVGSRSQSPSFNPWPLMRGCGARKEEVLPDAAHGLHARFEADVLGMAACCGAHFLARALVDQRHNAG